MPEFSLSCLGKAHRASLKSPPPAPGPPAPGSGEESCALEPPQVRHGKVFP